MFSSIVLCRYKYISMSSSKSSSLAQLFDDNQQMASLCSVSRSQNIQKDMINVNDEIYLFNNIHQPYHCLVYSTSKNLIGTIPVNESALFRIPCNKTILCADIQLAASPCKENQVIVTLSSSLSSQNLPHFIIPMNNMNRALVSLYQTQNDKFMDDFAKVFNSRQPRFMQIIRDTAICTVSLISFTFIFTFIHIFKIIKYKLQKKMKNLEDVVEDAIDF